MFAPLDPLISNSFHARFGLLWGFFFADLMMSRLTQYNVISTYNSLCPCSPIVSVECMYV